jgi:5-methyltetrahydropteroyltriglutamate--homocysteine methyltransferase
MVIPTEPIGPLPRPAALVGALATIAPDDPRLGPLYEDAIRDTIERLEAVGCAVVTDGEARPRGRLWLDGVATAGLRGLANVDPDGLPLPHADGALRRLPRLVAGPFRPVRRADDDLALALRLAHVPVKQTLVSPSALSLLYPADDLDGYPREAFLQDLIDAHEAEVRAAFEQGAQLVQIDVSDARLALALDPGGRLLDGLVHLNKLALARFSDEERACLGVYLGLVGEPGPQTAADEGYEVLLPRLFELKAGRFYLPLAGARDAPRALQLVREHLPQPGPRVFVGVVAPQDADVETAEQVRERTLQAAGQIPVGQLGTTDDAGYGDAGDDDAATRRERAFAKIRARVEGTALAAAALAQR